MGPIVDEIVKIDDNGQWSIQKADTPIEKEEDNQQGFQQKLNDIKAKYRSEAGSNEVDPAKTNTGIATADIKRKQLTKSNYGPKDMGLYSEKDNAQRKAKNTGEAVENAGKNVNVKSYTTSSSSVNNARAANEAKRQAKANKKSPVKVFTDEEKKALQAEMEAKAKV
jgi:hypothetical protein